MSPFDIAIIYERLKLFFQIVRVLQKIHSRVLIIKEIGLPFVQTRHSQKLREDIGMCVFFFLNDLFRVFFFFYYIRCRVFYSVYRLFLKLCVLDLCLGVPLIIDEGYSKCIRNFFESRHVILLWKSLSKILLNFAFDDLLDVIVFLLRIRFLSFL